MGLSGSGKSTHVRLLNRLIEPTSGQVVLEGRDIAPMSTPELRDVRHQKTALVFQSFALLPNRTVSDNIAYGFRSLGDQEGTALRGRARRWSVSASGRTRSCCRASCPAACSNVWASPAHWR
nr:ATP-binding cassette domain-containing protein [Burkholderia multivorans]